MYDDPLTIYALLVSFVILSVFAAWRVTAGSRLRRRDRLLSERRMRKAAGETQAQPDARP